MSVSSNFLRSIPSPIVQRLRPTTRSALSITHTRNTLPRPPPFSTMTSLKADSDPAADIATREAISQATKAQGGPQKGSASSKLQSEYTRARNAELETDADVAAREAISQAAKAEGGSTQKGSASAKLQSEYTRARNAELGTVGGGGEGRKSAAGQAISDLAKAEGGTTKGSASAKLQSELTKAKFAERGLGGEGRKSAAGQAVSELAKTEGGTAKGSASAKLQSELTKAQNAGKNDAEAGGEGTGAVDPATQSQLDREANFEEAQERIVPKMENQPEHVTEEDASLLTSRETKVHGYTPKEGVAAEAQRLAAENEKEGTV